MGELQHESRISGLPKKPCSFLQELSGFLSFECIHVLYFPFLAYLLSLEASIAGFSGGRASFGSASRNRRATTMFCG